jgi:hypothetical protein
MTRDDITRITMEALRREREREFIDELLAERETQPVAGRDYSNPDDNESLR